MLTYLHTHSLHEALPISAHTPTSKTPTAEHTTQHDRSNEKQEDGQPEEEHESITRRVPLLCLLFCFQRPRACFVGRESEQLANLIHASRYAAGIIILFAMRNDRAMYTIRKSPRLNSSH